MNRDLQRHDNVLQPYFPKQINLWKPMDFNGCREREREILKSNVMKK